MTDTEINEAVARKLHGGVIPIQGSGYGKHDLDLPDYCHSIEAAWEIVERMPRALSLIRRDDGKFVCTYLTENGIDGGGAHDTAPMAICLAFLKLKDEKATV